MTSRDLSGEDIMGLLGEIGQILLTQGKEASVYIVGGAAMAVEFDSRRTTHDIDAAIHDQPDMFWQAAHEVGQRHGLPEDWINTNAVAFLSGEPDVDAVERTIPGLRIALASPEHLIAMKMRSMRDRDIKDLIVLFREVGITTPQQAADIHDRLFDESSIGYQSAVESLYAAELVFAKIAEQQLNEAPEGAGGASRQHQQEHWVEPHIRRGRAVKGHWRKNPKVGS